MIFDLKTILTIKVNIMSLRDVIESKYKNAVKAKNKMKLTLYD